MLLFFLLINALNILAFLAIYKMQYKLSLKVILLIAIAIRIIHLIISNGVSNFDIDAYGLIGKLTVQNHNIYPDPADLYHPYFPVFLYLEGFANSLEQIYIPYVMTIKTFTILFDIGVVYFVYLLSNKNAHLSLLYSINPISILVTSFHGQFDSIPIFFTLLSFYLIRENKEVLGIMLASFAIAIKTWPILFILPIIKIINNKFNLIFLISVPTISIAIYSYLFNAHWLEIIKTIYRYRGVSGNYGLGYLALTLFPGFIQKEYLVLISNTSLITILCIAFFFNSKTLIRNVLKLMLCFFVVTLGFGIQWLSWLVPFLILIKPRFSYIFFITSTAYMSIIYGSWLDKNFSSQLGSNTLIISMANLSIWISVIIITLELFTVLNPKQKKIDPKSMI